MWEQIIDNKNWTYSFKRNWVILHTWKWGDNWVVPKVIEKSKTTESVKVDIFKPKLFDWSWTLNPVSKLTQQPTTTVPMKPWITPQDIENTNIQTQLNRPKVQQTNILPQVNTNKSWKISVDEFANKIKEKYPAYKDVDNKTLTDKMIEKYPDYKDIIEPLKEKWILWRVWEQLSKRWQNLVDIANKNNQWLWTAIQTWWQIAWWIWDIIWEALFTGIKTITPDFVKEGAETAWKALLSTSVWQEWLKALKWWVEMYDEFKKNNPETAANMEATFNIASLIPIWKGTQVLKKWWEKIIDASTKQIWKIAIKKPIIENWLSKIEKTTLDIIKPKTFTPTERVDLIKKWKLITWKWITWEWVKYIPDIKDIKIAKSSSQYIKKWKSVSENVMNLKKWISELWEQTKQEIINNWDSIFNTKTIFSKLDNIEKPVMVKSETSLNNAYDLVKNKVKDLITKSKKKYSSLLEVRKEFDNYISKEFPDLYTNEKLTPIKSAIMTYRRTLNDFISEWLPKWNKFKELLKQQSDIYEAIDMLAPQKDINAIWKFIKNPITQAIVWWWIAWWIIWTVTK
jgi:hypothetical protein